MEMMQAFKHVTIRESNMAGWKIPFKMQVVMGKSRANGKNNAMWDYQRVLALGRLQWTQDSN
jgi:hypothetical protein